MERPLKRQRLSLSPDAEDAPNEFDLQEARAQNDLRLKSIFEGIFEKYGQDFTDIGDEIDLQTGKIVVNNGHLHGMEGENMMEPNSPARSIQEAGKMMEASAMHNLHAAEADHDISDEGNTYVRSKPASILSQMLRAPEDSPGNMEGDAVNSTSEDEDEDDRLSVDSLLDTALHVQSISRTFSSPKAKADTTSDTDSEKANSGAEGSHQSQPKHTEGVDEPMEHIWRVPEIDGNFSTPTLGRSRPKSVMGTVRSQSPPGAGSLWALPRTSRRGTDVTKKKSRKDHSRKKRKTHSSSPIVCDWSFAEAPDGNESDDPLQEDHEPSPTPTRPLYIREKRNGRTTSESSKNTCSCCKRSFSRDDYIVHLKAMLADPPLDHHDLTDLRRQLNTITGNPATESPPRATADGGPEVHLASTSTPKLEPKEVDETNLDASPTKSKRPRTTMRPDEARLIIKLRQVQGMKWKEILDHFPQKKLVQLTMWNYTHWNDRCVNPPLLSRPWSNSEIEKLEALKDQQGLTWNAIRAEIPGRSQAEIEFELLRLWASDGVDGEKISEQEAAESKRPRLLQPASAAN
ncbi:hypothetical protein P175DRAFT_0505684 [Aspergillus ochraceoroseus IBT 24754]|uniref:Myb-like domain-containing protein n=1 Tax=Aspergillus ochraceoroseus IBT 24754 TaxID=1392256 RepID=A0A2T5M5U9_9EURO|nr:uncharacterized protein P175DRAFT_0505684 [Aspergillus ochraceoroseus IBT 24754]PTU23915.1 hypothetical protein P175DRAFT_0505684 [Aspergillus ochraceoroseus IBT 24754]